MPAACRISEPGTAAGTQPAPRALGLRRAQKSEGGRGGQREGRGPDAAEQRTAVRGWHRAGDREPVLRPPEKSHRTRPGRAPAGAGGPGHRAAAVGAPRTEARAWSWDAADGRRGAGTRVTPDCYFSEQAARKAGVHTPARAGRQALRWPAGGCHREPEESGWEPGAGILVLLHADRTPGRRQSDGRDTQTGTLPPRAWLVVKLPGRLSVQPHRLHRALLYFPWRKRKAH